MASLHLGESGSKENGLGYDLQRPLLSDLCYQLDTTDSKKQSTSCGPNFQTDGLMWKHLNLSHNQPEE